MTHLATCPVCGDRVSLDAALQVGRHLRTVFGSVLLLRPVGELGGTAQSGQATDLLGLSWCDGQGRAPLGTPVAEAGALVEAYSHLPDGA